MLIRFWEINELKDEDWCPNDPRNGLMEWSITMLDWPCVRMDYLQGYANTR